MIQNACQLNGLRNNMVHLLAKHRKDGENEADIIENIWASH